MDGSLQQIADPGSVGDGCIRLGPNSDLHGMGSSTCMISQPELDN